MKIYFPSDPDGEGSGKTPLSAFRYYNNNLIVLAMKDHLGSAYC
jgi:hypothetical protein